MRFDNIIIIFTVAVVGIFITILNLLVSWGTLEITNFQCSIYVFNICLSVFDISIEAVIAIIIAFVVLEIQDRIQRKPIKQKLQFYVQLLDDVESDTQKINKILQQDNRIFLRSIVKKLSKFSSIMLQQKGADEFQSFEDDIDRWNALLKREEDSVEANKELLNRIKLDMLRTLESLVRRY